jgi:FdrA protein
VAQALGKTWSNISSEGASPLDDVTVSQGHTFIDFGDDELTLGRPHPMIDYTLRLDRLRREARDPETAVVLLDVVLGYGAHPDPAGALAPVIGEALRARDDLHVVVVLCGARADPQGLEGQRERLRRVGATVTVSNERASALAIEAVSASRGSGGRP